MVNILEVVQTLQNDLRRKGIPYLSQVKRVNSNIMITCPYHKNGQEKSPSCGILLSDRVSGGKVHKAGTVHCFTCGETHSLEEMISHVYHKSEGYGKEWLLENFNILSTEDVSFNFDLKIDDGKPVKETEYKHFKHYHPYFATRGISEAVANAFDLGYDEFHDSVVLPLFDKSGRCIMLIKRSVKDHVYMNTSGASKTSSLFGIHMVYRKLDKLVNTPYIFVVEGAFDALRMWQNGFPAVGILQAAISETQLNLLRKLPFQKIVIATDNDEAGRRVAKQLADKLKDTKEVYMLAYPQGRKDPGEMTDAELKAMRLIEYRGETKKIRP